MTGAPRGRGKGAEARGRRPCEDRGREWSHAATSQGTLRVTGNHQKLEKARKDTCLGSKGPFRKHGPDKTRILDF